MEVASLVNSVKIAYDIAKGMTALKSEVERNRAISKILEVLIVVQKEILSMQNEHSSLTAKVQELEKESSRLKDWTADRERYHRKQIAPGIFAYLQKGAVNATESVHKLCCNCFDKTIKSTLQQSREPQRMIGLVCPNGCPKLVFTHYLSS